MKQEAKTTFGRTIRWTWAAVAAVLFHLVLYWSVALTRDSKQELKRQSRQFAEIQYLDSATEEMSLFDPRPMLLPTRWNSSNAANFVGYWQEEEEIFPEFPPEFELEDGNYIDDFGNVTASYDRLSRAQVEFGYPPFRELGREISEREFVDGKGLSLALQKPENGATILATTIYNDAVERLFASWPDMRPAVLLATVESSFPVGGVSVVEGTGFIEADRLLTRIVYGNLAGFGPLADGVYLLEIVP
ncbi:hypothetical protein [Pelagicoccus albus]|uniref:Uncharacterized protein n=1 Tax=Pelagicoccus albus TaxID=415222 RepID=A0A7X1E8J6_9BACT|nr:hypothetical protein [Pelagicoccus albus]MBC2606424.1 hypothetical protein [Pelagicoccus albus]